MSRTEVQRKVRVTAAVVAQRPAHGAVPGPDGGFQMRPVVGAQTCPVGLIPVPPLRVPPGQLMQEPLATGVTGAAAAALVPGEERSMWWRCGGKIPPLSLATGHLRHTDETTFGREHPVAFR